LTSVGLSGELAFLFGSTNVGKTILAVQIADALAKGAKIQGFDGVTKTDESLLI